MASTNLCVAVVLLTACCAMGQTPEKRKGRDILGDPLPPGAIARLGHLRLFQPSEIQRLALSFNGKRLACFGKDRVYLWDTTSGKELANLAVPDGMAYDLVFSRSGRLLAAVQAGALSVWDVERRRLLYQSKGGETGLQFSADEKKLFAFGSGYMHVLEARTGKTLWKREKADFGSGLAIHPNEKEFVWVGKKGVMIQRLERDEEPRCLGPGADSLVFALKFHPNGRSLAMDADRSISVIEFPSCKLMWKRATDRGYDSLNHFAFSADGKCLACRGQERGIEFLDSATGKEIPKAEIGGWLWSLSGDGRLVAGIVETRPRLWDFTTGKERSFGPLPGEDAELFFHDNAMIQTVSEEQGANTWEVRTGKWLGKQPIPHEEPYGGSLAFCPNKRWFLKRDDESLRVFDARTGKVIANIPGGFGFQHYWLSSDGKQAHCFQSYGKENLLSFDVTTGKELQRKSIPLPMDPGWVSSLVVLAPNKKHAAFRVGGVVLVIDINTGKELCRFENLSTGGSLPEHSRLLCFSSDSQFVLNLQNGPTDQAQFALHETCTGRRVHSWPVVLDELLFFDLGGHPRYPYLFTLDMRYLITGGSAIRIWEIPSTRPCAILESDGHGCSQLALSPDGKTLASSSYDGTVLLWDLERIKKSKRRVLLGCSDKEFNTAWEALTSEDASAAFLTLLHDPDRTMAAIRKEVRPVPHAKAEQVQEWIQDLKSPKYALRQRGQQKLMALQEGARPALEKALSRPDVSLEEKRRLKKMLATIQGLYTTPTRQRQWYSLDLLERIGGKEAREILEDLATGNPEAELTRGAQTRLARWER